MFKKTEETEWTKFSKALSSRDSEEAEGAPESETSPTPAATAGPMPTTRASAPESSTISPRRASAEGDEDVETIIGEHTSFDGNFKCENSVRIRGMVKGELESKRSILVEAQATVEAKLKGETVTVAGQVKGEIVCSGRLEIKPSGRVVGEINAGTLIMQEGAFFEGNLKMGDRSGEESSAETESPAAKAEPRPRFQAGRSLN